MIEGLRLIGYDRTQSFWGWPLDMILPKEELALGKQPLRLRNGKLQS